jgi:hypothetical protein
MGGRRKEAAALTAPLRWKLPEAQPIVLCSGYKNRPNILKFGENRWNWAGLNSKTVKFIVHCFKIIEKDKS